MNLQDAFAIESLNQSHGSATAASESSIIENIKLLARTEGIYTETAGGVVISVLQELVKQNKIQKDDLTVAFMTGNGLKTQEIFTDSIIEIKTSPNLKDFENYSEGLFCFIGGEFSPLLLLHLNNKDEKIDNFIKLLIKIFKKNLLFELQRIEDIEIQDFEKQFILLAEKFNVPLIGSNNIKFEKRAFINGEFTNSKSNNNYEQFNFNSR